MTPAHKAAIKIFESHNYTCQYCEEMFSEDQPPLHVHHRVFKQMGKTDKRFEIPENKTTCCAECHGNHGKLKGAKLFHEKDFSVIEKLTEMLMKEYQK